MPSGAELFVQTIQQLGISEIFTLVGDHLNEVLAVAARAGIRIIDMRHESGVTHAADAWARVHRKPALSLVTGGPGHTNSLTGIATASLALSPLIAISGARATGLADRQAFQDIDQVGMARPVVKWAAQPSSAAEIPFYLSRAFSEATSARQGPVHLTIPVDLFRSQGGAPRSPSIIDRPGPFPESRQIDQMLRLLASAKRPIVIAGSGIWWAKAERELQQFIELASLPLYTLTMARGAVSDEHPLCFGYADPSLNRAAHQGFQEADLFLVLGKRMDYRLAFGGARVFPPDARFIQVDIHAQELGMNRKIEVGVVADVRATLQVLIAAMGTRQMAASSWLDRLRALREQWRAHLRAQADDGSSLIHPAAFFYELLKAMPPETLYSWDGGDFVHWGRAITPALHPGGWLRLGPLGTIGSALPNGIAMKLASPEKPVAVITGDGSLGFYIAEMDTAVRYKLPLVIIVGNDAGWGLERELQKSASAAETPVACELRATRYDLIMKGFGGDGETIDSVDQVQPAIQRAFGSSVPYCINVNVRGTRSPFTEWQIEVKQSI